MADMANPMQDDEDNNMLIFSEEDNIDDMYLTFGVGGEEYGVGIAHVTELVGMQRIMDVPDVPPFIKGVINLRGKVIPIMDVRLRFHLPERAYDERTVIIVLDVDNVPVGMVVERVDDVVEIPAGQIDQPPQSHQSPQEPAAATVVKGLGKLGERVIVLLDVRRLVSDSAKVDLP